MKLIYINLLQALRHLRHNIGQSIMIAGILSVALTAFIFSASSLWNLTHEESHVPDVENVYRVQNVKPTSLFPYNYYINDSISCHIRDHAPAEVKLGIQFFIHSDIKGTKDTSINNNTLAVNAEYFDVMQHEFVCGTAAKEEGEIVITEKTAKALFGATDIVGNLIEVTFLNENNLTKGFRVSGVMRVHPESQYENTFDALINHKIEPVPVINHTYAPNTAQLFIRTKEPDEMQKVLDETCDFFLTSDFNYDTKVLQLIPHRMGELLRYHGDFWNAAFYPSVFFILSSLLLLSALLSYLSLLNTAADRRWTDHRLRICLGGGSKDTLRRLQAEVALMFGGIGIVTFILITFTFDLYFQGSDITLKEVYLWFVGTLCLITASTFVLCYLPVYVQNRRHRRALQGAPQGKPWGLNYPLAVIQVAVSVLLFFLVLQGGRQIHFLSNEALGVNAENVYTFNFSRYKEKPIVNTETIAQEIVAIAAIDTCIHCQPIFDRGWSVGQRVIGFTEGITVLELSEATMRLFGIQPKFWKEVKTPFTWKDNQILISSNAASYYGVTPENPYIYLSEKKEVIGTLDLCTRDLHQEPERIAYMPNLKGSGGNKSIYFRILPDRRKEAIAAVEEILRRHQIEPDAGYVSVINYGDLVAKEYRKEKNYLYLYGILSVVGLCITLFGLLTLISANLQHQRRALAIHRIFGANFAACLRRTLRTYLLIIAIGITIGLCLGYYLMTLWLETYSYHITLGFLPALGILLIITLLVTLLVALKVRSCFRENPANVIAS